MEKKRCMRLHAGLPESFWAEFINHVAYLVNRSPFKLLNFKCAEKVWSDKEVDYSTLKVFGCKAYVHIPSDKRNKLKPKSLEYIFLGFEKRVKVYKLWDPKNKKKVMSRDVLFDERLGAEAIDKDNDREENHRRTKIPLSTEANTNPEEAVSCFALSKNDSYVMSASGGKISLFNMMTFKTMTTFMAPPPAATFLAFHPQDNNIIAIGMDDSTIQIYNVRVDEVRRKRNNIVCFIEKGKLGSNQFFIQVKSKLRGHSKRITGLAFSNSLNVLVSSGADSQLFVWGTDGWEKQKNKFLQIPSGHSSPTVSDTRVQFHQDQIHFLAVHETQIALYETSNLECVKQWVPREGSAPISHATFSCDSQLIYASFLDASVCIFNAANFKLRCRINPAAYLPANLSSSVYPTVIAAHPSEPNQLALGLTDGNVHVLEPLESEGRWGAAPPAENGSASSMSPVPPAGSSSSDQPQR
ncbi:topless-related protein 1-like [Asparagus officinalis]|uniref:topless-related protein 1-like n=1 Tax=Asparagus officinalis TaxID=4686 RepID=UPI00098E0762|nr:topless-related protein 1-like [Asparagus officinalis]